MHPSVAITAQMCIRDSGYASVAFAALDNINANTPDASMAKKLATLTAP